MVLSMAKTQKINVFRKWRDDLGLTQEEAGKRIGVTQASYSRFERDEESPGPEKCNEIQKITGIPREHLRPDIFGDVNA